MSAPRILYRHPDGLGIIVADPANLRLVVSSAEEEQPVCVTIGPAGLRTLAEKLCELAEGMEGAQ
ncbi:MAG: hypothetical protein ACYC5W_15195 [Thauera sp.]